MPCMNLLALLADDTFADGFAPSKMPMEYTVVPAFFSVFALEIALLAIVSLNPLIPGSPSVKKTMYFFTPARFPFFRASCAFSKA